ncbi:MAG TPA: DUF1428 family protein [Candidatus Angelobacter sp.]|nr:DUF1428 family protein [Candidatus Angelobacter sp.]
MVTSSGVGDYVQLFLYRVPKKNHDAMIELERRIKDGFKKHGVIQSEFFQLTPHETVRGFTNFTERITAQSDEEVWFEVERYRSREHRDEIFAAIRKDTPLLELFGKWYGLVSPGENSTMGDFNKLKV